MPAPRLDGEFLATLDRQLAGADAHLAARYPGDPGTRQPVHTVYVPADRADVSAWGAQALALMDTVVPVALPVALPVAAEVYARVRRKLADQPVEDLRIDFEDGYGARPDAEEDTAAVTTGGALAGLIGAAGGPSFGGIRFKSLGAATRRRGLRTLDLVVGSLLAAGPLPDGFVVTLPKVTSVDQVGAMAGVCSRLEAVHGLDPGQLRFEVQVETAQAIVGADGTATVAPMVHAAGGRCAGLHYGTYDYSAGLGIAAAHQSMEHPAADHAKAVMQVAAAGTGVRLSDGSTNVLPAGPPEQVAAALALHARLVRRSLERGFYQGWDLHPGHLISRYLATYGFYREGLPVAVERLRNYLGRMRGGVLDEPATAQALASFLIRGLHCGALDDAETGFDRATLDALAGRRTP
ncbi:MAG: aldolase [Pseudonocardiales bacterium]|nr:MAG: aldolase [Pseudonocardiales bacterium]